MSTNVLSKENNLFPITARKAPLTVFSSHIYLVRSSTGRYVLLFFDFRIHNSNASDAIRDAIVIQYKSQLKYMDDASCQAFEVKSIKKIYSEEFCAKSV